MCAYKYTGVFVMELNNFYLLMIPWPLQHHITQYFTHMFVVILCQQIYYIVNHIHIKAYIIIARIIMCIYNT